MSWLFLALAAIGMIALLGAIFARANPTQLAVGVRLAGPLVLAALGAVVLLTGRAQIGGMLLAGAGALYVSGRRSQAARKTLGQRSTVRTAALEMELDHDTGGLEGVVLAGSYEGRVLGKLDLPSLLALRSALSEDPESLQLLETYLEGRFPAWRDDARADMGDGQRGTPGSGAMSEQEAYQILDLEPGAGKADIRKAHRRLMQRLHPDLGGSSFLAARINQAKDVLLSMHE